MRVINSARRWQQSSSLPSSSSSWLVIRTTVMMMMMMLIMMSSTVAQECDATTGVCDKHERCSIWKDEGECLRNKSYMNQHCPVSCSFPAEAYYIKPTTTSENDDDDNDDDNDECHDLHPNCHVWADLGECKDNAVAMNKYCPESCGKCGDEYDDNEPYNKDNANSAPNDCQDTHEQCSFWASKGECENNSPYMHTYCALSCNTCAQVDSSATRKTADAATTASATTTGQHLDTTAKALLKETIAFGVEQTAEGAEYQDILDSIQHTITYMNSDETKRTVPEKILKDCQNRHELCSFWQVIGECTKNKAYMALNCAPVCQSCHLIDLDNRCPKLQNATPALQPGDLNKMFQRIIATAPGNITNDEERRKLYEDHPEMQDMPPYTVVVHSRPSNEPMTEISAVTDKSLPPWVITFENFMTDEECNEMIQLGYKYEYKRSEDVGAKKFDGTFGSIKSEGRTSKNSWCSEHDGCRLLELPQRIHKRMSDVMNIPSDNSEDLQILKYEKGEFYKTHHDYIPHQKDRQCGPRILTFFLYLSDVDAGGGTNFPNLDITIMPKKGRALLWPSVLDSDPFIKDGRLLHQALPVEAGVKYAANGWIHMYDYQTPQKEGCN